MNNKAQQYHAHYTGDIPFGIWVLLVSVVCIGLGWLIPDLAVLAFIGWVLFALWVGAVVIAFLQSLNL